MAFEYINKDGNRKPKITPNIENISDFKKDFIWEEMFEEIPWLPGGGLNNAYVCIDSHVDSGAGDNVAMIWNGKNDAGKTLPSGQYYYTIEMDGITESRKMILLK